jgi:hypothetical protein
MKRSATPLPSGCGPHGHTYLPKQFLLGALPKEKLLMHNEVYYREQAIDVMPGVLAVAVDAPNRLLRTNCAGDMAGDRPYGHEERLWEPCACCPRIAEAQSIRR